MFLLGLGDHLGSWRPTWDGKNSARREKQDAVGSKRSGACKLTSRNAVVFLITLIKFRIPDMLEQLATHLATI